MRGLCQENPASQLTVPAGRKIWKPHNLSYFQRHYEETEMYTKCRCHISFFSILAYNLKARLYIWINWWLVWTAKPWVLIAQKGTGVTRPCPMPSIPFTQGSGLYLNSVTDAQGQAIHTSLNGAVCPTVHAGLLQQLCCSLVLGWEAKPSRNTHSYPQTSIGDSSIGTFVIRKGGKQPSA